MMFGEIAPAYSMKPRRDPTHETLSPGLGGYDLAGDRNNSQYSFGRAPRQPKLHRATPGPGHYASLSSLFDSAPAPSFARSSRLPRWRLIDPGPGSYNIKALIGRGPGISMKVTPRYYPKNDTPGPGAYGELSQQTSLRPKYSSQLRGDHRRHHSHWNEKQSYSFATASRDQFKPSPTPGPGSYASVFRSKRVPRASLTPRLTSLFRTISPGPGSYNIPSTIGLAARKSPNS